MTTIRSLATGIVYRNPKPYLRSVHAYHPSIAAFEDGELVVGFDRGAGPEALDYGTLLARSGDGGRTWAVEGPLFTTPSGRPTTHSVRLSRADGGLVGFGGLFYRDNPDEGLVNRRTLGYTPMDLILTRSQDRGRSWSEPSIIQPPLASPAWETCHHIVELPDGRWLAPTATWPGWNGENPAGHQAVVFISDDRGASWPAYGRTFDGRGTSTRHWEQSVVPLQDGRILAVAWVHDPATGRNGPTPYSLSHDGGRTFSAPRPTGLRGQTCKVLQLRDGRILAAYRRDDQPGLWAALATLEGDAWRTLAELPLWQGTASGMTGHGNTADELSALYFGYPSLVQLQDGDALVVYWCVEDLVSNIRWFRLRVGP